MSSAAVLISALWGKCDPKIQYTPDIILMIILSNQLIGLYMFWLMV